MNPVFSLRQNLGRLNRAARWALVMCSMIVLGFAAAACTGNGAPSSQDIDGVTTSATVGPAADPSPPPPTAEPTSEPAPTAEPTSEPAPTAEPTPTPPTPTTQAPGEADQPRFIPFAVQGDVESVDFRDGFTYVSSVAGGGFTVTDGAATRPDTDPAGWAQLTVLDVVYGDLDGDDRDEAAVTTMVNTGGSGNFTSVGVYRIRGGELHFVGETETGDRAFGGVYDADVTDGFLIVENFWTDDAACCPTGLSQTMWVLDESAVLPVERFAPRAWLVPGDPFATQELGFFPNTSSAVVAFFAERTEGAFEFTARLGQELWIESIDGPPPAAIQVVETISGDVVASGGSMVEIVLPVSGRYRVEVDLGNEERERTSLQVAVIDGPVGELPTWSPRHEQIVHQNEPLVSTLLTWPAIESGSDRPSLARINGEIETIVRSELDKWLAALDITGIDDVGEIPSEYEIVYDVALVTPDLVAIHFSWYEYVCCRPYPNYGSRAVVADLAEGRLLEVDELVDAARLDDLQQAWLDVLARDQGLSPPEFGTGIRFTALTLQPNGIHIATDRGVLGGAALGAPSALVTFDELGDLVNPAIVARARSGAVPTGRFVPLSPIAVPSPTPIVPATDIPPESRTLAGIHGLTLQWISWEPDQWGSVDFVPIGVERYAVSGRQDGPDGDYVQIEGVVSKLSDLELRFEGTVEMQVSYNNGGQPCVRDGPLQFLSTAGRRFWRMQDLLNCDGIVTDYVDIYFG